MYDVIIAGAGPAGSTCAYECSKRGLKTLLLDRVSFPRHKPCGGAVAEQALSYLDFPLPPGIIEHECFGAVIRFENRRIEIRKKRRIAVLVSRDKFDSFLLEKAVRSGTHFLPGENVAEVIARQDSVEVKTGKNSYRASYLIGADGVHSVVARSLRPAFSKDEMALALVSSVPAPETEKNGDGMLDMHFGLAPMGYGWDFPHAGYRSVGIMGLASKFSSPHKVLSSFASGRGIELNAVRGHFIPFGGIRRKIVSGRIALAGDAAGFADPFQGEGIVHAIHSGKLAAQAVAEAVKSGNGPAGLSSYARRADTLIRKNLRHALSLGRMIDRFPNLSLRIFFHSPGILDTYLEIPAGRLTYGQFRRRFLFRGPLALLASFFRNGFRIPPQTRNVAG